MRSRCSHPGGAERCRHCRRNTCATCHHGDAHLAACSATRDEVGAGSRRRTSIPARPFATPKPAVRRQHEVAPELREAVFTRAGGLCELCGERLQPDWHWHHRKRRSQGGEDSVSNGVALHNLCHRRIHGHVAWAESVGFLLRSTETPSRKRIALHGETWVQLRADGTYGRTA